MKIALYRGKSLVSYAIRWITRSPYSHAAFCFDTNSRADLGAMYLYGDRSLNHRRADRLKDFAWRCASGLWPLAMGDLSGPVIEAWQGGVKCSPSLSTLHTPGTPVDIFEFEIPLDALEERQLIAALADDIGDPYSYLNVLRFITRTPGREDGSWFCSELVFQRCADIGRRLLERKKAWEVPPDWIQMSPQLRFEQQILTT
ncbi:MAG: hypothetical protein KGL39_17720 [Patescibacteria group bacterium]|nr:hypothetical protein [Patescibacteria group bacterium]